MDPLSPPSSRRKTRFTPKASARGKKLNTNSSIEKQIEEEGEADGASEAQTLIRQFNENRTKRGSKSIKKTEVVFGGSATTPSIRWFGRASESKNEAPKSSNSERIPLLLPSKITETSPPFELVSSAPPCQKEYREPWDYGHSYFPTVLPMRLPHSGDLDTTEDAECKQAHVSPASELGLMEENEKGKMIFFQLPPVFPMVKQKGKHSISGSVMGDLPAGFVGKMLVYKSGAVVLKMGNTSLNVSPGLKCKIPRDAVAINRAKKQCCVLGEVSELATVTVDSDQLLNSVNDLA